MKTMDAEDALFDKISVAVSDAIDLFIHEQVARTGLIDRDVVFVAIDEVLANLDTYDMVKSALRQHGLWD